MKNTASPIKMNNLDVSRCAIFPETVDPVEELDQSYSLDDIGSARGWVVSRAGERVD